MHADARLSSKSVLRNMLHSREVFHEQAHKQASLRLSSGSGCRAMMRSRSDKDVAHARKACRPGLGPNCLPGTGPWHQPHRLRLARCLLRRSAGGTPGDPSACGGALSGNLVPNVFINGLPVATLGSIGSHGNVVIGGSGTVIIGTAHAAAPTSPISSPVARSGLCLPCLLAAAARNDALVPLESLVAKP